MRLWRNIKDIILSFYYPSNQVFIVSYPNSGRSWLKYMLKEILSHANQDLKYINFTHDCSEIIVEDGTRQDPNLIFKYNDRYRYIRSKVIFLSRDPRDIIVSNYHQVTKRANNPFCFNSISDFITHNTYGFKRIIHFFNLWNNNRNLPKDFLLVKYEKLLEDGNNELMKILDFLSVSISNDIISEVYNKSSAKKMRKKEISNILDGFTNFGNNPNALKVRKAKKGSYFSEMSNKDIAYCNKEMRHLNSYLGYNI